MAQQVIQTSISGYGGRPETVYSLFDEETSALVVISAVEFAVARREGAYVITNDDTLQDRDGLFRQDDIGDAVTAYGAVSSGRTKDSGLVRMKYKAGMERLTPSIQSDGINRSGLQWMINPNIINGQVAVLATCWYVANTAMHIGVAVGLLDDLSRIMRGEVVTI